MLRFPLIVAVWTLGGSCSTERIVAERKTDGSAPDRPIGTFGTPQLVGGLLDPADALQDPTLSGDELELYFSSTKLGNNDIWRSTRADINQPWGRAVRVEELSTADRDLEPDVSFDGLTIYLSRDPMATDPNFRVFVAQRPSRSSPWNAPQLVTLGIPSTDRGPTIDRAGLNLVFGSNRAGSFDLFSSRRTNTTAAFDLPQALSELNSPSEDWDPALFLDGLSLAFGSRRTSVTTTDLFETSRPSVDAPFAIPVLMRELNSAQSEGDPWLSNDGRHIVFSSERDGTSRLYEAWR